MTDWHISKQKVCIKKIIISVIQFYLDIFFNSFRAQTNPSGVYFFACFTTQKQVYLQEV